MVTYMCAQIEKNGASSGLPHNALHSLVVVSFYLLHCIVAHPIPTVKVAEAAGRSGNASEAGEVHLPHARSGVLGAQDLPGGTAAN